MRIERNKASNYDDDDDDDENDDDDDDNNDNRTTTMNNTVYTHTQKKSDKERTKYTHRETRPHK